MSGDRPPPSGRCPECGAETSGRAGCQLMFDEVLAREFGDFQYARAHRLTVDTYSLPHPHEYMQSAKSFAARWLDGWIENALKAGESRLIWHDRRRND